MTLEPKRFTRPRIIPLLLLRRGGLFKSQRFSHEKYVGDPINAVRIFNEKAADELIILDATATTEDRGPDLDRLGNLASECFMPLCYGGGITRLEQIEQILRLGVEKICLGAAAIERPELIQEASRAFGRQSIVVCLDVCRGWWSGERVVVRRGTRKVSGTVEVVLRRMEDHGAGEIIVQAVDRDGMMGGYDLALITRAATTVAVPIIALGGAGSVDHLGQALKAGAAAAASGSSFVFQGPHRAVLITYPGPEEFEWLEVQTEKKGTP